MGSIAGSLSSLSVRLPLMLVGAAGAGAALQTALSSGLGEPRSLALGAAGLCAIGLIGWRAHAGLAKPLAAIREAAAKASEGGVQTIPGSDRSDEIGGLARVVAAMVEGGTEAARIRAALDVCRTCIMVCDAKGQVVYVNRSLLAFFAEAQEDFRAAFPGCSAKDMLGKVMEAVQPQAGAGQAARVARLPLGRRTVSLTLTPVTQADGGHLGMAVEWLELTDELAAGSEVAEMVAAAVEGDFSRRVPVAGKPEALARIAEGMNRINELVETALGDYASAVGGLAEGDLTQRVRGDYRGRFAALQNDLNATLEHLGRTVSTIQATAGNVARAAGEINAGAGDLATRTEQTAVNLEETAATTEQLAASVKQSAARSRQATDLAQEAMGVATQGQAVVAQTVGAIERVEASSARISEIVGVIDEIAFQTNLLALNAAVEAARAGDAGKGFAVVASEVRALAQRSSQAARDIKGLIASSNEQVGEGVRFVRGTGDALERIVTAAGKVSGTVAEISQATAEQAHGIEEMSQAVAHMDETTQANSALAEQSATSAAELMREIETLRGLVAFFQTGGPTQVANEPMRSQRPVATLRPAPARRPDTFGREPATIQQSAPRRRVAGGGRVDDWAEF